MAQAIISPVGWWSVKGNYEHDFTWLDAVVLHRSFISVSLCDKADLRLALLGGGPSSCLHAYVNRI